MSVLCLSYFKVLFEGKDKLDKGLSIDVLNTNLTIFKSIVTCVDHLLIAKNC